MCRSPSICSRDAVVLIVSSLMALTCCHMGHYPSAESQVGLAGPGTGGAGRPRREDWRFRGWHSRPPDRDRHERSPIETTHNDLRFAVEALSGGLPLTIIRGTLEKCPARARQFLF